MQHYENLEEIKILKSWLTIGTFDGVHLGHQQIINSLIKGAQATQIPTIVVTFFPHPAIILGKRNSPSYLTSPIQRAQILGDLGVDIVLTYSFTEQTSRLTPFEFLGQLKEYLGFTHLVIGHDFVLGKNRSGNESTLQELGAQLGFSLDVIPPFRVNDRLVSSSEVRQAILDGNMQYVSVLLGRTFSVSGCVISGDGRGKEIGIPTANLDFWNELVIPKNGVYACWVEVNHQRYQAVTNIGFRPTFTNTTPAIRIETHLLNYSGNLYGEELSIYFIQRLRDEIRFSGIESLITQIKKDIENTKEILKSKGI
jgi:riboflavin kinase/FMN adenylyltransferase